MQTAAWVVVQKLNVAVVVADQRTQKKKLRSLSVAESLRMESLNFVPSQMLQISVYIRGMVNSMRAWLT